MSLLGLSVSRCSLTHVRSSVRTCLRFPFLSLQDSPFLLHLFGKSKVSCGWNIEILTGVGLADASPCRCRLTLTQQGPSRGLVSLPLPETSSSILSRLLRKSVHRPGPLHVGTRTRGEAQANEVERSCLLLISMPPSSSSIAIPRGAGCLFASKQLPSDPYRQTARSSVTDGLTRRPRKPRVCPLATLLNSSCYSLAPCA